MADEERRRLDRIGKLYDALRETMAKAHDITEEIGKLSRGEAGIGDRLREVSDAFCDLWQGRYRSKYAWQGAKDAAAAKRLLRDFSAAEIIARASSFLRDHDAYNVTARHPFTLFAAQFNRYAAIATDDLLGSAITMDCRHDPPCRSDQEHTRRKIEELRS